jgi:hypothetical protein
MYYVMETGIWRAELVMWERLEAWAAGVQVAWCYYINL